MKSPVPRTTLTKTTASVVALKVAMEVVEARAAMATATMIGFRGGNSYRARKSGN